MPIKNQAELIKKMNEELDFLFSQKINNAASDASSSFVASDSKLFDQNAIGEAALGVSTNHILRIPIIDTRNVSTEFITTGVGKGMCITMNSNIPQQFHTIFRRIFNDYKLEDNTLSFNIYDGRDEKICEAKEHLNIIDNILTEMRIRINDFNRDLIKNTISELISREEEKKKKEESEKSITERLNKR